MTVFCLLLLLFTSCKQDGEFDELKESSDVYAVAIEEAFSKSSAEILFISDKATSTENDVFGLYEGDLDTQILNLKKIFSSADEEVLRSFLSKHQEPAKFSLENELVLTRPYKLLDGEEVEEELRKPVLGGEPNKLPGPILKLSRVGFNSSYDKAFLRLDYVYCPLCGFGTTYLLEKKDGKWTIKEQYTGWMS